jgi:hypothetical protein
MRLYVCWGTFGIPAIGHPCGSAHRALTEAGHDPDVIRSYGWAPLPAPFNRTRGRREAKRLSGADTVPVLVTDDGDVIAGSTEIVSWASANPAGRSSGR